MTDRSTKILLLAIALGLWANVAVQMTRPARADSYLLTSINDNLASIRIISTNIETYAAELALGSCRNKKLC